MAQQPDGGGTTQPRLRALARNTRMAVGLLSKLLSALLDLRGNISRALKGF